MDFREESIFGKLRESGYDPKKKTIFLWEGVTLYLTEADVRKTLQDIRGEDLKLAQTFFMGRSSTKGPFMAVAEVDV